MGIHGSPTCIMNFEDSVGYLIGEPNNGLKQMFTFMNTARIGTAIQGIGAAGKLNICLKYLLGFFCVFIY